MHQERTPRDGKVEALERRIAELEAERTRARPGVAVVVGCRREQPSNASPMANVTVGGTFGATVDATVHDLVRAQHVALGRVAAVQNFGVAVRRVPAEPAPSEPRSPLANSAPANLFGNLDKI